MKIFVTGGLGFIGSNFISMQIDKYKNEILNFDKLTYAANVNNLLKYKKNKLYNFVQGDIVDSKNPKILNSYKPDCIINFAAESHVDRSIDGPKEFINTNIIGTYELLNATLKYYELNYKENEKIILDLFMFQLTRYMEVLVNKAILKRIHLIILLLHILHQKHLQII